ncbi:nitronate monooxygenase, partial [Streptomyces harbinensis]|uniref:nitronate monooxygenase n=1 Tax=Streptomyces harbinensis TaxID=1176198 RepID=UPI0034DF5396
RGFSGRPARGLRNRFLNAYTATAPAGYPAYRAALAPGAFASTAVTRAFSGRPARGPPPPGYPLVHQLTRPLRAASAAAGDPEGLSLWAGTGHRYSTEEPAGELTRRLWREAEGVLSTTPG